MFKKILFSFATFIFAANAFSQTGCPGCVIDNSCSKPQDVTICPPALPDACFNAPYDENLTFYVPKNLIYQGTAVTLASIQLVSITNIPAGLSWTLDKPSGFYTVPSPDTRGCIKICGTPTVFGTFFITVTVNANVTSPINTTQTQSFTLPLVVKNCGGGNPFFSYNQNIGCDTLGVQFEGTYLASAPKQTEFVWDFGDGTTGTGKKPARKFYSQPGTYLVNLQTQFYDLTLDSVTATVTGDWWCGDVEEPKIAGACTGQPDPLFYFTSGNSTITGPEKTNSRSATWSTNNLLVNNQKFRLKSTSNVIRFIDVDAISANDDGGTATITINGPGVYQFSTVAPAPSTGGVTGNIYIGQILDTVYSYTDTITVNPLPPATAINYLPDTVVCSDKDIVLSVYDGYRYVWIKNDTSVIPLEVASSYTILADPYSVKDTISIIRVEISDTVTGCIRKTENLVLRQKPAIPLFIEFSGIYQSDAYTLVAEQGYSYQWLLDGFPIAGATSASFQPPVSGNYSCLFTNSGGCFDTSNVIAFVVSSVNEVNNFSNLVSVMPNPSKGNVTLYVASNEAEVLEVSIYNNMGQLIRKESIARAGNSFKKQFDFSDFAVGNYVFHLNMNGQSATKRFVIAK